MSSSFPAARFPAFPLTRDREVDRVRTEAHPPAVEELSDEVLITRICDDDPEALGLLFRRYARLVWTIALRILRNKEEADDLLQDVFLLTRRRASAFDSSKGNTRSLLVQMTYQRAFSRRRDLVRRGFYDSLDAADVAKLSISTPPYDESLEAQFGRAALRRALDCLSVEQHEALRLSFEEGYTLEEVAAKMGISLGNVRHHYYRGLGKLRKELLSQRS